MSYIDCIVMLTTTNLLRASNTDSEVGLNTGPLIEHACVHSLSHRYVHPITEDPVGRRL